MPDPWCSEKKKWNAVRNTKNIVRSAVNAKFPHSAKNHLVQIAANVDVDVNDDNVDDVVDDVDFGVCVYVYVFVKW